MYPHIPVSVCNCWLYFIPAFM